MSINKTNSKHKKKYRKKGSHMKKRTHKKKRTYRKKITHKKKRTYRKKTTYKKKQQGGNGFMDLFKKKINTRKHYFIIPINYNYQTDLEIKTTNGKYEVTLSDLLYAKRKVTEDHERYDDYDSYPSIGDLFCYLEEIEENSPGYDSLKEDKRYLFRTRAKLEFIERGGLYDGLFTSNKFTHLLNKGVVQTIMRDMTRLCYGVSMNEKTDRNRNVRTTNDGIATGDKPVIIVRSKLQNRYIKDFMYAIGGAITPYGDRNKNLRSGFRLVESANERKNLLSNDREYECSWVLEKVPTEYEGDPPTDKWWRNLNFPPCPFGAGATPLWGPEFKGKNTVIIDGESIDWIQPPTELQTLTTPHTIKQDPLSGSQDYYLPISKETKKRIYEQENVNDLRIVKKHYVPDDWFKGWFKMMNYNVKGNYGPIITSYMFEGNSKYREYLSEPPVSNFMPISRFMNIFTNIGQPLKENQHPIETKKYLHVPNTTAKMVGEDDPLHNTRPGNTQSGAIGRVVDSLSSNKVDLIESNAPKLENMDK